MFGAFSLLLARLFLSLLFLLSAFHKLFHWHDTEQILISALSDWQGYVGSFQPFQNGLTFLVSWSSYLLVVGVSLELLGALMILLGMKERIGALFLIFFLVPATLLFHHFWFLEDANREQEMIQFLKNLTIVGGLILAAIHGVRPKARAERPSSYMID